MRGYNGDAQYEVQGLLREASNLEGFTRLELSMDANEITFGFVFNDFTVAIKFLRTAIFDSSEFELTVYLMRIIKGVRKTV